MTTATEHNLYPESAEWDGIGCLVINTVTADNQPVVVNLFLGAVDVARMIETALDEAILGLGKLEEDD